MGNVGVLVLGLLALATIAQGEVEVPLVRCEQARNTNSHNAINAPTTHDDRSNGSTSGQVARSDENRDLVLDGPEGGTARGGVCNDNNVCTDDSITPTNECIHSYNSVPCDDNSVCTTNDHCSGGFCAGTAVDCNDGNECTDDSCNPSSGCVHTNNSNPCTDGLFCNGRDSCSGGSCSSHTGNPCPPDITCDDATQSCGPGPLASVISFKAVKINNVPITPGTCNLGLVPPRCSTGNVNQLCASAAECHVGTSYLIPNKCAGGSNINHVCSTNATCPGSTCVSVLPGDTIEVEFFLSRWAAELPGGVHLFQVQPDATGFVSPDNGTALPLGWCAPVNGIGCTNSSTCPRAYPICALPWGCTCAGHNPDLGAFMTTSRADFLLSGLDGIFGIQTSSVGYKYFGLALDYGGTPDPALPRYLGTLILKVSATACGTFTIGFVEEINSTFIADPATPPNVVVPASQPLALTISDCAPQLWSCDPSHCTVDARIPHDRDNQAIRLSMDTFVATFSKPTTGMTTADFEATLIPTLPGDVLPGIASLTPNGNTATIVLSRRIQQTRWTCVRHKGSDKRCCFGSLPGDANSSHTSTLDDPFEIFDNLMGRVTPALALDHCDTDRSTLCSPADMLMVIDLLNGADAFTEVNGDALEVCPAMRPAP